MLLYRSVLVSTDVHRDVYDVSGDSISIHDELEFPLTFALKTDSRGKPHVRERTYLRSYGHHNRRLTV